MINVFEDSPYFVNDVEFSGADGNVLRNNAIFLDGLAQQPIPVRIQGLYKEAYTGMFPDPSNGDQPHVYRGGFLHTIGVDSAVYVVDGNPTSSDERIRIYHRRLTQEITDINAPGTLVYDAVWPSSPTTILIDISDDDYDDGEVIETTVQVYYPDPPYDKSGVFHVQSAYTEAPSNVFSSFGGLPTFNGTEVTAEDLNQFADAQDWIMSRVTLVPRIPFNAGMFALGTHKSDINQNPRVIQFGWLNKGNAQDTFHGIIDYYSFNGQEYIKVYIDGNLMYTSPMLTNGQVGTLDFTFDISSLSDDVNYPVIVEQEVVAGQGQAELSLYGRTIIASRFTIKKLEATASRSYFTPDAEFGVLEQMTFEEWKNRLNNFVSGTELAYNRINDNANIFDRNPMFRRKLGWNRRQITSLNWVNLHTQVRIGERFIVAGKDVKIAWGGYTLTKNMIDDPSARDIYEFTFTEQLTGSTAETKEIYFDQFEGLFVGTQYYLLGEDISYFAEFLR